jgi:hypothetical protein
MTEAPDILWHSVINVHSNYGVVPIMAKQNVREHHVERHDVFILEANGLSKREYRQRDVTYWTWGSHRVTMKGTIFWNMTTYSLVEVCRCFRDTYYLRLQGKEASHARKAILLCQWFQESASVNMMSNL